MNSTEYQRELENIITPIRLKSYGSIENYIYNMKISESFYPALSLLEITLRNKICFAVEDLICKQWLISELNKQNILANKEYEKLIDVSKKIQKANKKVTNDRLISELTLGFWVHLCTKHYKTKLWDKRNFFEKVFPNYSCNHGLRNISPIQNDLLTILKLRNRIFHHEIIINGKKSPQEHHQLILNLLHLLSNDVELLLLKTSRFTEVIKQKP